MDDKDGDQRLPHVAEGADNQVSGDMLIDLGVLYWKLDADKFEDDPELEKIRNDRGYDYHDIVTVSPDKLPNYETKVRRRRKREAWLYQGGKKGPERSPFTITINTI